MQVWPKTTLLTQFCERGTRRRRMFSRSGILDDRPVMSAAWGGGLDTDGSEVDAGCGRWADLDDDDVGVADGAGATGDAELPADNGTGPKFDDDKPFRLRHHASATNY